MSDTYPLMRKKRMVRQLHKAKGEGMTDELKVVKVVGGRKPPILKRYIIPCEEKLKAKYEF